MQKPYRPLLAPFAQVLPPDAEPPRTRKPRQPKPTATPTRPARRVGKNPK